MTGIVIAGAGQAGFQVAASLREHGFDGRVTLVGEEPAAPYQRPPLSKQYLTGAVEADRLPLRPAEFYARNAIDLVTGDPVTALDPGARRVRLASGAELPFDRLVLATGARHRPLPVPGADLDGVLALRTLADAGELRERLRRAQDVVVVGAGFIGLEFAAAAAGQGLRPVVIEAADRPLTRAVSPAVARFLTAQHRRAGVRFSFGTGVAEILGTGGRVRGVRASDRKVYPADLVLVGIGVLPNAEPAAAARLATRDGIVVDEFLTTACPAISAIGDCARHPSPFAGAPVRLESVQNAVDQARCVAAGLTGAPAPYTAVPWFWSDQGPVKLQIAGLTAGADTLVPRGDPASGRFSVLCFREGRFLGAESVNRPVDHMTVRRLLAAGTPPTPEQAADPGLDLRILAAAPEGAAR